MSVEAIVHQSHTGQALDKGHSFITSITYSTAPLGARLLLREACVTVFFTLQTVLGVEYGLFCLMDRANRRTVLSKLAVVTVLHR